MATEEQTTYDSIAGISGESGGTIRWGQRLTITNRIVSKLSFPLSKLNSPTGNITFTIRKVSDDSIIMSKVWADASTLPTYPTIQWKEVTFDTATHVNEEVRISFEFSGGDVSNQVVGFFNNGDIEASAVKTQYITSWSDDADDDAPYIYTYSEWYETFPTDPITRVTSLTHRYDRGTFTLEINLGEVVADFGLPEWESKPKTGIPKEEEPFPEGATEEVEAPPKIIPTREEFWRIYPGVPYPYD